MASRKGFRHVFELENKPFDDDSSLESEVGHSGSDYEVSDDVDSESSSEYEFKTSRAVKRYTRTPRNASVLPCNVNNNNEVPVEENTQNEVHVNEVDPNESNVLPNASQDDVNGSNEELTAGENPLDSGVNQSGSGENQADITEDDIPIHLHKRTGKRLCRKRTREPSTWLINKRKKKHDLGQEYVNARGKKIAARSVKTYKNCDSSCKFKCAKHINEVERNSINNSFYRASQADKTNFIGRTTERTERKKRTSARKNSRRAYSFSYFFLVGNNKIRVCKQFYLGTINISQKPVYTYHANKDPVTGIPAPDRRGKTSSRSLPEAIVDEVRKHINSFPRVESHYNRENTKKTYLESSLNLKKMYNLYVEQCREKRMQPVKISYYRKVFNTDFNIAFHTSKKDLCDQCEEYNRAKENSTLTPELEEKQNKHVKEKEAARSRQEDRNDKTKLVLCFDLENVISCPKSEISNFFYKRKLNTYNMTAHATHAAVKNVYCCLWTEVMPGRDGNDIASSVLCILEAVVKDFPTIKTITLWSDSCVPQNRNRVMSYAISYFIQSHPHIEEVILKYSTPGHSCVQEVDNVHSQIEHAMRVAEFCSPVSFLRLLKKVNESKPFTILRMKDDDFKDFHSLSKPLQYKLIPYTQVTQLQFKDSPFTVGYKTSHMDENFTVVSIRALEKPQRNSVLLRSPTPPVQVALATPKVAAKVKSLDKAKQNDLLSMMKWFPIDDQRYYEGIFKKYPVK